jgi:hypothetical protein
LAVGVAGCSNKPNGGGDPGDNPGNQPPVIVVQGTTKVPLGSTVRLDASNTADPEGDTVEFYWEEKEGNPANNFLDGVTLTDPRIQMVADVEGTFTFLLSAKDSLGNEASSPVTLTVTAKPVPPGASPVLTGIKINGVLFDFATTPSPTAFTTASKELTLQAVGTDSDSDPSLLVTTFTGALSGNKVTTGYYQAPDMLDDADGFRAASAQVWLEDPDGHKSVARTINFRIVPKATQALTPRALFVDCGAATNGTGTMGSPYNSIQSAYTAASGVSPLAVRPDLYIASGTCAESVAVDFNNVNLYGLFDPAAGWRRKTEAADIALDKQTNGASRFHSATILRKPGVTSLLYTNGAGSGQNTLQIDGISFQLDGNFYGMSVTTPATENETLIVQNSEFIGQAVTAAATPRVGGGLLIEQGPGTNDIIIRRNFFAVGAMDDGSRFQVWTLPKSTGVTGARRTQFLSNVVYAGIGLSESYSCSGSQNPFAVCLFKVASEDSFSADIWNVASRNLFWITQGNPTAIPTALTTGGGYLKAFANVFRTAPGGDKLRFMHAQGGYFEYDRFPVYAAPVTYWNSSSGSILESNYYNCLSTGPNNQFGRDPGTGVCGNLSGTANGSAVYTSTTAGSQPWRLSSTEFNDVALDANSALTPEAKWDFDGRYGAGNDVGGTSSTEYNAGPFEPLAPYP